MNSKRRTGYGVYDLTRHVARRLQQEWEMVESPPRLALLAQPGPRRWELPLAVAISSERPVEKEKRPLAA
ncbi:MAG: hypothetical protein JNL92_22260 [Opitutaceae bacterium]|nr:hypothetical protein [Opitutaceae bacterium]